MTEKISREELVRIYNVEITFFDSLEQAGLLSPITENEQKYLLYEDLQAFERFMNWHYDLEVNLPGLEVIQHLLQKMEELRSDNVRLHRRLGSRADW